MRAELERVLASRALPASERRRAFLRYIVEETLSGRADRLKGYSVALAVFGRTESFDAQADPVVRLEARRLRRDLDSYYVAAGSRDPVRITIPKGSYVPLFEWHEAPHPPSPIAERGPALAVLPFKPLGSTDESRYLAEGLSQELVADLMRFPGFRLYSLLTGSDGMARPEPARSWSDLGVSYVVSGSVRGDAGQAHVAAQLLDAETGRVLWTGSYDRPLTPTALIGVQSELAGEIATLIGAPYGAVVSDLQSRNATPGLASLHSYFCVLRAYAYRRSFSRADFDPVLRCLEEAVRRDPGYSDAWAMLAWLHLDAGRFEHAGTHLQDQYEKALQTASRAVALDPNSTLALKALSSINHYMGRYDEGERLARCAVALNPHDPDTLAQLGWRLAARGKFEEGIPIVKRAIERTVNPPGWYFDFVAIDLLLKKDYRQMLQVAERSVPEGTGQALIAIASAALGDRQRARAALHAMSGFAPLLRDPAAYFRRHGAIDEIVDALMAGLESARALAAGS